MSNTNSPFGFRPIGRMDGGSPTAGLTWAKIKSDNSNSFFAGDPLIPLSTGYLDVATASTVQIAGVAWEFRYYSPTVGRVVWSQYYPTLGATGDISVGLITDPDQLFVAQSDGTAIAFGDINANIQLATGTGNTYTQQSGFTLHQATITTTDTLPFRIVDLWSNYAPPGSSGTDNSSSYNWAVVAPNNWSRKQLTSVG